MSTDEHAERFTLLRPLLFTIVYEILGSVTESDDVLQNSYLRWAEVDLATVRDTKSYLAQLVTRQALNAVRTSTRRREDYIGSWLPEPLLLDENDASTDVLLAESVSMAMLVLLETLTPDWRFEPADAATTARITERFMTAASTGDLEGLLSLLAPDVTWTADSGGKTTAARRPVVGAEKVAAVLMNLFRQERLAGLRIERVNCNNTPAMVLSGERLEGVFLIEIADGKITNFYAIRNPDKLLAVAVPRQISR
ncbi:nuclear transport factor 2 family protein [Microbispora sp. KK1-11]|uniref:nuclear transport factor 2 family protein n=1 Tax=Microbispora sp. KK1-11 TaxID=2053005 RepID=UPI0011583276|nr:nuclear transport factor 2 family protein [Microbispora sp. KK1-11]TQS30599.1 RNA polymerase subunit sigma-24 [Microbispora sp. KK1-11]